MGTCERVRQTGAYRDGELTPQENLSFEAHLAGCAECKAECAQLAALSRLLTTAQLPEMPQEVAVRLHEDAASSPQRSVLRLAESLIAAAAVITVACGGWLWHGSSASEPLVAGEADWQSAAVTLHVEAVSSDAQQLAQWMVEGLTVENGNE